MSERSGGEAQRSREIRELWIELAGEHRGVVVGLASTAALSLVMLIPPLLTKVLIDDGLTPGNRDVVAWVAMGSAVVVGITFVLRYLSSCYTYIPAYGMVSSLQQAMFARFLALPLSYHQAHPLGQSISRLTNDTMSSRQLLTSGLPVLTDSVVTLVGAVIFMFALDWRLAGVTLLVVLPALGLMTLVYQRVVTPLFLRMREAIGNVTHCAVDSLDAIDLIQAYNQEERQSEQFVSISVASGEAELRTVRANAVYYPGTTFLSTAAMSVLVILGGVQVVRGNQQVGTVVGFFGYLQMFLAPLLSLSAMLRNYEGSMAAVDKCIEVIDEPIDEYPDATELERGAGGVEFAHVGLEVEGRPAVEDLDVSVPPGSIVVFVGDASSGRAEIGRLAAGYTAPTSGSVVVDGIDLGAVTAESRSASIGYVSATSHVFAGTIRDNLRLAAPHADDAALESHLALVCGQAMVDKRLRLGLDTPVGRSGRALPGGTRQAILIARALLRDPTVLVLDGVTDALDMSVFEHMAETTRARRAHRTIIVATNQPIATEYADEVIVMRDGRVIERGTPADLRARGAVYAGLRDDWRHGLATTGGSG